MIRIMGDKCHCIAKAGINGLIVSCGLEHVRENGDNAVVDSHMIAIIRAAMVCLVTNWKHQLVIVSAAT